MKEKISDLAKSLDDYTGNRISNISTVTKMYNKIMSGNRQFGNIDMYIPPQGIGVQRNEKEMEFISMKSVERVFWDIGSNVGYFALCASEDAKKVRAFEPEPNNYKILEQNANMNQFSNIEVHDIAVSDNTGTSKLFVDDSDGSGIHSLAEDDRLEDNQCEVSTETIDDLVDRYEVPDFVKIDVEGAEQKVIEGASDSLKNCDIEWFVEVHSDRTGQRKSRLDQHGGDIESVYEMFKSSGHDVYGYTDEGLVDFDLDGEELPLHWFATKKT